VNQNTGAPHSLRQGWPTSLAITSVHSQLKKKNVSLENVLEEAVIVVSYTKS
jgi:hypothetical protein